MCADLVAPGAHESRRWVRRAGGCAWLLGTSCEHVTPSRGRARSRRTARQPAGISQMQLLASVGGKAPVPIGSFEHRMFSLFYWLASTRAALVWLSGSAGASARPRGTPRTETMNVAAITPAMM